MNYFLILVILGLCGGGYYEYTTLQQKSAADQQQITDLGTKLDALQAENKKLDDDKTQLTNNVADAQTKIADLTKQVQEAQSTLVKAKQQDQQDLEALKTQLAAATAPPPPPPTPTNNLGTIATVDGKTFQNCQLLKVEADGIVINQADGIIKIVFPMLPSDLQKKFGYDPNHPAPLTDAQIEHQEEQRKAAAQAAGN
jgi:DNA repair exonuclease SbcCD ATPase subunit